MITLDEAIIHAEEVAEENENVVNTGTFEDGHTVAEIYCDDTECIEAHLSRCAKCAEEYRQLAEWLKELKRLREQPRWIPVSEGWPKVGQRVLITYNQEDELKVDVTYFDKYGFLVGKAIAWMPLPEPYKEESENKG